MTVSLTNKLQEMIYNLSGLDKHESGENCWCKPFLSKGFDSLVHRNFEWIVDDLGRGEWVPLRKPKSND